MKSRFALAAALLAATVPGAAQAAYQITNYSWSPGFLTGTIQHVPTALSLNVAIGRFKLTGTEQPGGAAVSFLTYCVDIFHALQPASYDFAAVATLVPSAIKQNQLLALLANADPLITTAANPNQTAAAIQLAVWEISNETAATYSFSAGAFRSSGGNSGGARTLAMTYLNNITGGTWTAPANGSLQLLYSANSQSQLIAAVPEPATWAMMLGGFGVIGAAARRRKAAARVLA